MKNPIKDWTKEKIEYWRRQPLCVGAVCYSFTLADRDKALAKLGLIYEGRIMPCFAERILLASEIY